MKTVNLEGNIQDFRGNDLSVINSQGERESLKVSDVFLNILGNHKAESGKEALLVFRLGLKMANSLKVELEEDDMVLLHKVVDTHAAIPVNPAVASYTSVVLGCILDRLD